MACDCIDKINEKLAERNTKLTATIIFAKPSYLTPTIDTELVEKKRGARPCAVLPTFCPFCGTKYEGAV
jgi:hypothetical protein